MERAHRTRFGAAVVAVALAVALGACSDDDDDDAGTSTTSADGGGAATVVAEDFSLTDATVAAGAEVTFTNDGDVPHTMTADDGGFDTGTVGPGDQATVAAPGEAGDYPFACTIHPAMTATLTVEG
jgi:plastocyanin